METAAFRPGESPCPIQDMLQQRRSHGAGARASDGNDASAQDINDTWGLALSGGGIRSATFGFGVLSGLARQGLLHRFDFLSTVSGGGYIGGMYGRLLSRANNSQEASAAMDAMADAEARCFGRWLRANGRYLEPSGTKDRLFALASYVRNTLGVHVELALIGLLLGIALCLINAGVWWTASTYAPLGVLLWLEPWMPTLWVVALPMLALAFGGLAMAYWFTGWAHRAERGPLIDALRNRLTAWLAGITRAMAVVLVLGAADRLAWWIAFDLREREEPMTSTLGVLALLGIGSRVLITHLEPHLKRRASQGALLTLAHALGLILVFLLMTWWIAVVQFPLFSHVSGASQNFPSMDFGKAWKAPVVVAALIVAYGLLFGRRIQFLNLSSLHHFYRARLIRSYLGATNPERLHGEGRASASTADVIAPLPADRPSAPWRSASLSAPHDDLPLEQYAPQRFGGPIHLINCCLNQTTEPSNDQLVQDRKGRLLTVSSGGHARVGTGPWMPVSALQTPGQALTLGSWMSISGAAVSPGLGFRSRTGLSALLMCSGLRLGYWLDASGLAAWIPGMERGGGRPWTKSAALLDELLGRFKGLTARHWHVSDGGHLENTGAYTLLAQRCKLIVLVDSAADPDYGFDDLAQLVRMARIDLGADIEFLQPRTDLGETERDQAAWGFGGLSDLVSVTSTTCLALAHLRYADGSGGHLVLIKPNLCAQMPLDLLKYKQSHPGFPQESTIDQAFGEAQWESYRRLGWQIASQLHPARLSTLLRNSDQLFQPDSSSPLRAWTGDESSAVEPGAPPTLRQALTARPIAATVGFGAVVTAALGTWHAIEAATKAAHDRVQLEQKARSDLVEQWGRLGPAPSKEALAGMAVKLSDVSDSLCARGDTQWFTESELALQALSNTRELCDELKDNAPPGCAALIQRMAEDYAGHGSCLAEAAAQMQASTHTRGRAPCPRYWGYDYRNPPKTECLAERSLAFAQRSATTVAASAPEPEESVGAGNKQAETCRGQTVYLQIYGPQQRANALDYQKRWHAGLQATVPGIEDVVASSARRGLPAPRAVQQTTVRYHDLRSLPCAEQLAAQVKQTNWLVQPLSPKLKATPGVIEVWIAPTTAKP